MAKKRKKKYRLKKSVKRALRIMGALLVVICLLVVLVFCKPFKKKEKFKVEPEVYSVIYDGAETRYTFDVKAFLYNERANVSINDYYNLIVIDDQEAKVTDQKNELIFTNAKGQTTFNYKNDTMLVSYNVTSAKVDVSSDGYITLKDQKENTFFVHKSELYVPAIFANLMTQKLKLKVNMTQKQISVVEG